MIYIATLKHIGEIVGKVVLLTLVFSLILAVLFIPITVIAISSYGNIDFNELLETSLFEQSQMYVLFISFIGAVMLMYALFERGKGLALGWRQQRRIRHSVVGIAWGFALATVMFLLVWLCGGLHIVLVKLNTEVLIGIAYAILLFAFVATYEGLLIRGYIQGIVRRRFGVLVAIIVSSISFVVLQLLVSNIEQGLVTVLSLLLFGLFLALLREVSGGLWLPMGLHFAWYFFHSFVYGFSLPDYVMDHTLFEIERRGSDYISGGQAGAIGSVIMFILFAVAMLYVWQRYRRAKAS